jgi:hypothetical protein
MSSSDLIRWGGLAALVGGVLFVVAELLGLPTLNVESFSETATTASFAIQQLLFLLGVALVLLGLVGLYARQSEAVGALGLISFLVAFLGTVLIGGFFGPVPSSAQLWQLRLPSFSTRVLPQDSYRRSSYSLSAGYYSASLPYGGGSSPAQLRSSSSSAQ